MKKINTTQFFRKAATTISGAALLLAVAGSAFGGGNTVGGGNTPVTNLQGVTITPDATGECFTIGLASGGGTYSYAGGTGTIAEIGGFFIFSVPQITTTGTPPTGYTAETVQGSTIDGATGYLTGYSANSSPILPGQTSPLFCFSAPPPAGALFVLDVFTGPGGGAFPNTGKISFTPPTPPSVPEPSSIATLAVGSLGLMGMALSTRKRRRASGTI